MPEEVAPAQADGLRDQHREGPRRPARQDEVRRAASRLAAVEAVRRDVARVGAQGEDAALAQKLVLAQERVAAAPTPGTAGIGDAEELHDDTERLIRAEIREIPDGAYRFTDQIDGLGENPEPIVFEVA